MARGALTQYPSLRGRRAAAWISWSLAGLSLAMFVAGLALYVAVGSAQAPSSWGTGGIATQLIFTPFLAFSIVGALIVSRHPRNSVGWICVADGFVWMLAILTGPYTLYGLANPGSVPFPVATSALTAWLWVPAVGLLGIYLILLFPDGGLPSPRWRFLAWFAGAVILLASAGTVLAPGPLDGLPGTRNPFGLEGYPWVEDAGAAVIALLPLCILASAASLILRFRRSGSETRQQIKWLASAATLVGLTYLGTVAATLFVPGSMDLGSAQPSWLSLLQNAVLMSYAVVPVAVGIAVLKYRLYNIDLVINRALVYGVLTACVVGLYVLVVGGLGALLQAQGNLLVSILAAGLVAALFQPLRERLQRGVDRLMYGERDDPYAVLLRMGRRLEETLAPEAVLPAIVENVAEALRLPHVAVWLIDEDAVRLGAAHGRAPGETLVRNAAAVEILRHAPDGLRPEDLGQPSPLRAVLESSGVEFVLPLTHRGELVGALCMASRGPGEDFSPADRRLLRDLATQAGTAAHSVRLTLALRSSLKELRRSREELVAAQDEERRRVQRDLHDGLGPALASMRLRLEACLDAAQDAEAPVVDDLERLYELVGQATKDVRRLVYDLRPPVPD